MCVCVCVCVCVCLSVCVHPLTCDRVYVFVQICVCMHIRARAYAYVCRRARARVSVPSAALTGGRPRVRSAACHRSGSPAFAAVVTGTSRTTNAPWAARRGHTSVVDAAGAIYVIGGIGYNSSTNIMIGGYSRTYYRDVWKSTDGADRTR